MDDAEDKEQDDDVTGLRDALLARAGNATRTASVVMCELRRCFFDAIDDGFADARVGTGVIFGYAIQIGAGGAGLDQFFHGLASRAFARIARAPAMTSSCE